MATINASVNISSDIMSYATSINKTMTMKKAGTCNGLEQSNGLSSKKFSGNTTQVDLYAFNTNTTTSGGANKVYIRNTGSDRLYGGDWMLFPWEAASADHDIMVQPSTTEIMTIEYMVFYE